MSLVDARVLARCHRFTELAALGLVTAGATVLAGWALDIEVLRSLVPGLVAMNPTAAVAFMLAGVALLRLFKGGQRRHSSLALACSLGMVLIGASRLVAYVSPLNLGFDQMLFSERLGGNHMAPNTAFNFIVDGLALALVAMGAAIAVAQAMVMLAAAVAFMALLGYLFQVPLFGLPGFIPMALTTSLCFLLVELALLAGSADKGCVAALVSRLSGGRAARRLLGPAVLLPLVLGWMGAAGARQGWFAPEFAVALVVTLSIIGSVLLTIGISQVKVSEQPQPEVALASADQALYRAKREGRNRVQAAAIKLA